VQHVAGRRMQLCSDAPHPQTVLCFGVTHSCTTLLAQRRHVCLLACLLDALVAPPRGAVGRGRRLLLLLLLGLLLLLLLGLRLWLLLLLGLLLLRLLLLLGLCVRLLLGLVLRLQRCGCHVGAAAVRTPAGARVPQHVGPLSQAAQHGGEARLVVHGHLVAHVVQAVVRVAVALVRAAHQRAHQHPRVAGRGGGRVVGAGGGEVALRSGWGRGGEVRVSVQYDDGRSLPKPSGRRVRPQ
jgi:hypothetical protein